MFKFKFLFLISLLSTSYAMATEGIECTSASSASIEISTEEALGSLKSLSLSMPRVQADPFTFDEEESSLTLDETPVYMANNDEVSITLLLDVATNEEGLSVSRAFIRQDDGIAVEDFYCRSAEE